MMANRMLVKHWGRAGQIVSTEVPNDKVEPAGKVGDPYNLQYNRIWSLYFPAEAELVKVKGYYGDPWFADWRYVGPSPAPYTMMAVKVGVECKKGKPTGKELTDFALKLVACMRGHAAGVVEVSQLKGWTKEELHGTADILLEDLREGRTEELERLYLGTCGEPFKEVRIG